MITIRFKLDLNGVNTEDAAALNSVLGLVSDELVATYDGASYIHLTDPASGARILIAGNYVFDAQGNFSPSSTITGLVFFNAAGFGVMSVDHLAVAMGTLLDDSGLHLARIFEQQGLEIYGTNGNDVLGGDSAADVLYGLGGDDLLYVGAGDTVVGGAGTDTVRASVSWTLGDDTENLDLNVGAVNGTGNAGANVITGNAAGNALAGLDGNDTLSGGAGDDTLTGGRGDDTLYGDEGADSLDGGEGADRIYGRAGADVLTGGIGADILDGGGGADSMAGGEDGDTYYVDDAGDAVTDTGAAGTDVVFSSVDYVLAATIENLTLTGTANVSGTGNAGANVIIGNAGNNVLSGAAAATACRAVPGTTRTYFPTRLPRVRCALHSRRAGSLSTASRSPLMKATPRSRCRPAMRSSMPTTKWTRSPCRSRFRLRRARTPGA